jgi:integrase
MTRHLQKRGRIYHYRFKVGGREYTGTTEATDLATAKIVLEQVRRDTILGDHGIRKAPSLQAVAGEWMATKGRSVSASHLRAARQSFDSLKTLHRLPLNHITTVRVDDWRATYLQDHSPASANLVLRYLKMWMRWAIDERLIREMPYKVAPLRVQQKERPVVREPHTFLENVEGEGKHRFRNPQVPAGVTFALMLGLRESEVLNARWEYLKGSDYIVQGNTKSKRTRVIPIPDEVRVALLLMLAAKEKGPAQFPRLGLIFPGQKGKPHKQGWLRQALRRGGVAGIGMHRLRASFATLHMSSGTDPKETQEMLGHADLRTTMIYRETSMEEKAAKQSRLWRKA